ncbi:tRNA (adenosine(37)-N6)-threonylcarbamoyltransferase complex dimerization subunit type 1 TsaB [Mobiluncus mulieris]|uniref:tRNA (adenosine(37)-N6)-threonylcarbamoyltransferase complex dimerization subunit type 1 TsaB n=1 Tax=Mobiluncus mulieris TaxID=2052 RepID=UPI0021E28459|nr:tRNA (adenosine(37)-N6)-threonylcarbamoyltransferase complex dimerization subunit type 1 TsaB [Mobiluncus mulieris]MCU9976547.1 tRNA (adenosine(37)-N6)-threonylcarbamoyltransferase complex dimerization subunit type 1 TsaB [Mobiluncus mulieris]
MRYLYIDTCAASAVALVDTDTSDVKTAEVADSRSQVESLSGLISRVLAGSVVPDCVMVSRGPAPFTGLRVGLVTARALGAAWGVPVLGVDELTVQATAAVSLWDAASRGAIPDGGRIVTVMDARRHEVYAALFAADAGVSRLSEDWVGSLEVLVGQLTTWDPEFPGRGDLVRFVGNKADAVPTAATLQPGIADLARAAQTVVARCLAGSDGETGTDFDLEKLRGESELPLMKRGLGTEPEYLRRPDIQEKK